MGEYGYKALQNLTRARFFAVSESCQRKAAIRECAVQKVFYYDAGRYSAMPSTLPLLPMMNLNPHALANMDLHELTDFIIEKGKRSLSIPCSLKPFRKLPAVLYRLPKTVNDSVNQCFQYP